MASSPPENQSAEISLQRAKNLGNGTLKVTLYMLIYKIFRYTLGEDPGTFGAFLKLLIILIIAIVIGILLVAIYDTIRFGSPRQKDILFRDIIDGIIIWFSSRQITHYIVFGFLYLWELNREKIYLSFYLNDIV
jgi:hypothetical protein